MENDLHIKILKCVRSHEEPITISVIAKKLGMPAEKLKWLNDEASTGSRVFIRGEEQAGGEWPMSLSMIGWQILLDFESLDQARKSSRTATWFAVAALIVAAITPFLATLRGFVVAFHLTFYDNWPTIF